MLNLSEIGGIDFGVQSNFEACLRRDGKLVERREGHNVFTVTGRNWLTKLISWQTISSTDVPFTHRRVRWIGVGVSSQFEVTTVTALANPTPANATDYIVPIDHSSIEFPTSTSVRFIKEFSANEISVTPGPAVVVTEAGLFVDVNPWNFSPGVAGTEDTQASGETTTLDPQVGSNSPVAYKAFEGIPKTQDFTLEIRWEFRF